MKISSDLLTKIRYLHRNIKRKEWSGPLVYKIESGKINNPENLVISAENLFLMDIGTAGSTSFEMDQDSTVMMFDHFPQLSEGTHRTGLIHSHHDMKSFFSGTDDSELADNTASHNMYLSLIVNYDEEFVARVAFTVKSKDKVITSLSYTDIDDTVIERDFEDEEEKEFIGYYDCDIQLDAVSIDENFINRYEELSKPPMQITTNPDHRWNGYLGLDTNGRGDYYNHTVQNYTKKKENPYAPFFQAHLEKFCVKMIEQEPDNFFSFQKVFSRYTLTYNKDANLIAELVDDCMISTLGLEKYKKMTVNDKFDFLEAVLQFLEERDDQTGFSPIIKYKGAEILFNIITDELLNNKITDEQLILGF